MKKGMSVYSIIGSIFNTILSVVVVLLIIVVGLGALNKPGEKSFLGLSSMNVLSESMDGDYFKGSFPPGSLIIVKYTPAEQLKVGDILTYKTGEANLTHRIVEVLDKDGQRSFITKGDNNPSRDKKAAQPEQIIGKVLFAVPLLGSAMVGMNNQYFLVCAIILTVLLFAVPYLVKDKKENS